MSALPIPGVLERQPADSPSRVSAKSSPRQRPTPVRVTGPAGKVGENGGDPNKEERSHEDGFRPEFTHQLFEEERIEGFEEGELTIRVLYTPTSLDFLVKIQTGDNDDAR